VGRGWLTAISNHWNDRNIQYNDETPLPFDLLVCVDGNNSLKRLALGKNEQSFRAYRSKYRVAPADVDCMRADLATSSRQAPRRNMGNVTNSGEDCEETGVGTAA
jgi:hypothetical protein